MAPEPTATSAASVAPATTAWTSSDPELEAYLQRTKERRLAEYIEFLRIPSISGLPEHAGDVRAAAEWLGARLQAAGLEHVEVCKTGGHPIVYVDWLHAGDAPTAVVYGHYDVQPVDPEEEWTSPPFEPAVVTDADGRQRILARGASDDKSNITIIVQAVQALLATRGSIPINLRFVFEGEEESASASLEPWLAANRHRLGGDVALICDSGFFAGNLPAITTSLRGLVYVQIDVTGPFQDVHSGVYGGMVANPGNALAQIIAALKDPDGTIRIPGFYDDVIPLTDAERAAFAALPFDEEAARRALDVPELVGEPGYTTLERIGARPTLDVCGIWGGFEGEGPKTIIPAHAHAKISCRLVANQDPERIFELVAAYIGRVAPSSVRYSITRLGDGKPSLTPIDNPATQAAVRALETTFGVAPLYIREGGSVPVCASFESILGLSTVLFGFAPPDGQFHAPNEWMSMANYETGIRAIARYWDEIAAVDHL